MDLGGRRQVPEEMQELLQQMQRTTTLLLNRMGRFPPASPQSRLAGTSAVTTVPAVVQPLNPSLQTAAPRTPSGSRQLLAPPSHTPPAPPIHTPPAPPSHTPPAPPIHTPPAPPSHTPPAPPCHIPPVPTFHMPPAPPFQILPTPTSHFPAAPTRSTVYQSRPDNVQVHLSRLFRPHQGGGAGVRKRKWETPWSHIFICLPEPQWSSVPTAEEARYYSSCGLGRKTVWFPHNEGDHSYVCEHLLSAFPPLPDAGGFVLACGSRAKVLEHLAIPPEGHSLSFVGSVSTRAPLYIIPLQRSLTFTAPPADEVPKVMEKCLTCQSIIPLCDLADRVLE
ncbi:cleavage and polyadenylation specificity factor subunit 6-like [Salarias fasciatus]|uniref:cleavage and polyadenylation specificity factor subunit 6-like n=1 Tax=Salarias fasciatus TaxID=181472 RepID=UPI001176D155|nr:cleavage and polyadenylation specificity factor subunit 6-like [Salarias fasciatus]XP_029938317.1 cleavage and polyadenylation specificity factor subunit 6-like [Salarias fasciatus]